MIFNIIVFFPRRTKSCVLSLTTFECWLAVRNHTFSFIFGKRVKKSQMNILSYVKMFELQKLLYINLWYYLMVCLRKRPRKKRHPYLNLMIYNLPMAFLTIFKITMAFFTMAFFIVAFFTMAFYTMAFTEYNLSQWSNTSCHIY